MSRRLHRPARVTTVDELPALLEVDGARLRVQKIIDVWRETGRWWDGETEKEFYTIEAGGRYIIYREGEDDAEQWVLHHVED